MLSKDQPRSEDAADKPDETAVSDKANAGDPKRLNLIHCGGTLNLSTAEVYVRI
jgi:hypothetical protein